MMREDRNLALVGALIVVIVLIAAVGIGSFFKAVGAIAVALAVLAAIAFALSR